MDNIFFIKDVYTLSYFTKL